MTLPKKCALLFCLSVTVASLHAEDTIPAAAEISSDSSVAETAEVSRLDGARGTVANDTAQPPEQSLDRMVVSATRTRRLMSETPASVTVISRKEIETSPAKDINDLIANKTGVQVRRFVGMGEGVPSDIIMRGIPGALA